MTNRTAEASPLFYARITGFLYMFIIIIGVLNGIFIDSKLIVSGNDAATATNILANDLLFRTGMQINGSWFVNGAIRLLSLFLTSCTWWSYRRAQAKYKNPRLKPKPPVICSLV